MIELFPCLKTPNTRVTIYTCEKRTKRSLFLLTHPKQMAKTEMTEFDCIGCAECPRGGKVDVEIIKCQGYEKSHNWSYKLHERAA